MIIAKKILKALSLSSLLLVSHNSFALEIFLEQWRDFYPQSTSSEIRCQLCHVQRSGGDPWNAYGRDIRNFFTVIILLKLMRMNNQVGALDK